jgi:hypothetical protein
VLIHIVKPHQKNSKNLSRGSAGRVTEDWKWILCHEQDAPQISLGDRNGVKLGQASPNSVPSETVRIQLNLIQEFRARTVWKGPSIMPLHRLRHASHALLSLMRDPGPRKSDFGEFA